MADLGVRHAIAGDGEITLPLRRHHQFGDGRERAAGADEEVGGKHRPRRLLLEGRRHLLLEGEKLGRIGGIAAAEALGEAHGAERRRIDRLDEVAGGEDDLGAAAADVSDDDVPSGEIDGVLNARKRQPRFPLGADDLDLDPHLVADAAAEVGPVAGLADGAGGDRPQVGHLIPGGDLPEAPQRLERPRHRLIVEHPRGDAAAQARWLPLLVEDPVGAAAEGLGDEHPHAVRPDVDRRQAAGQIGREVDLLVVRHRW